MLTEAIRRSMRLTFGWSVRDFDVKCGVMTDRLDSSACATCLKPFDRDQKIAVVAWVESEQSELYHFNCLPSKFCLL